jgi:hypothetical protein
MERYGCSESHSYIIGVYTSRVVASINGILNNSFRGGKYDPRIIEVDFYGGKNDYITLITTWKSPETESRKSIEFKISEGGSSKGFSPDNLLPSFSSVELINIKESEHICDEDLLELHSSYLINRLDDESLAFIRDEYEVYERKRIMLS